MVRQRRVQLRCDRAGLAAGATREPFTFYVTVGLIYLAITIASMLVFQRAESWANRGVRRA